MERYTVLRSMGSGMTSDVFLVEDKRSKRQYILKQMSTGNMTDQERARAKLEINVLQKIDHPNVVRYRESFSTPDAICIVMEQCATSLEDIIERKRNEVEGQGGGGGSQTFGTAILLEWMAELLSAVHHLHSKHILHRDIKPTNIFVTDTNHLKLGDFGVCKMVNAQSHGAATTTSTSATTTACNNSVKQSYAIASQGAMIGTPLYLAPEIFEDDTPTYSMASDIWALGAVFYEMCALRPPFDADNVMALMHLITTVPMPPFANGVDRRFEKIARCMLDKAPRLRPTAQELIDRYVVVPDTHPSHPSQRPERGRLIQKHHGLVLDVSTSTSGGDGGGGSADTSATLEGSTTVSGTRPPPANATPPAIADDALPANRPIEAPSPPANGGTPSASPSPSTSSRSSSDGEDDAPHLQAAARRASPAARIPEPALGAVQPQTPKLRAGGGAAVATRKKPVPTISPLGPNASEAKRTRPVCNSKGLQHTASGSCLRAASAGEHEEALRRIKAAKSKIDVAALRQHMKDRKPSSDGSDVPHEVLCPLGSPPAASGAASSPLTTPPHDGRRTSAQHHVDPLTPPSAATQRSMPLQHRGAAQRGNTIASVVEAFFANAETEPHVTLEELDDAVMVLNQYKLRRFGVY